MTVLRNIVVIGGSYVGVNTAQQLAKAFAGRFNVLLIEKNSHFQHLFAFPRFAVVNSVDTHKAFIPLSPGTFKDGPPGSGAVVRAAVTGINESNIQLDRKVDVAGHSTDLVPFAFLVLATGTRLTPPSTLPGSEKIEGVTYLRKHASFIMRSSNIVVIGGGAVGVQMATDIKEIYPGKTVTLVHSRQTVMNRFHPQLSRIVEDRCRELGVDMRWGSRVKLPAEGYPTDGRSFTIDFVDGTSIPAEFAIICTGQTPQSSLVREACAQAVNQQGLVRTLSTLQVNGFKQGNVFAVGDVADTGAPKAARPGGKQAAIVVNNIQHILDNEPLEHYDNSDVAAIHITLGVTKNVVFRNPSPGSDEPFINPKNDGRLDMGIDGVWTRRGGGLNAYL
ncbi:FAD/NAD(P)-binding domain-containing protein [Myriangium duriaei CBS 260.36]|uniref:FAD/NAD(P)-binding domain-containing protein n=1 Tax=Myriangium duriaei CBS 260.36 TaxID=1168546 RepID=A0A9P4J2R0_9PEZI|nr:FAD/NAD(P)-binding domain-containing protein [Myriangium duriaei CBS 260.36]